MVELAAKTPCAGVLPVSVGKLTMSEVNLGCLTSLAPYKDKLRVVSQTLKTAHGVSWPAANRATGKEGARVIWFGRETVLLAGPTPDPQLAHDAALTDQSDGWACISLSGRGGADVLARLVPIDLRAHVFKRGHTARTQLMHMNASITRTGADTFVILVFRSMAGTAVHDIKQAMEGVAARG